MVSNFNNNINNNLDIQKTLMFALTGLGQSFIDYGQPILQAVISVLTIIYLIKKIRKKESA